MSGRNRTGRFAATAILACGALGVPATPVGFSAQRVITTQALQASAVYATDLDGDGDADVLSASMQDGRVAWFENVGGGVFSAQRIIWQGDHGAVSAHVADLDGDGDADVLAGSSPSEVIAWFENLGGGAFSERRNIATGAGGVQSVHAADLDGDGDADVLSAYGSPGNRIAWHENLGGGAFAERRVITTEAENAVAVQAADLDGDGDADVLSASTRDDKVAWYENLGGGAFSEQRVITTDADGPYSVHAADVDGDGDMDVLTASTDDDKVAWHENIGGGAFSAQRVITTNADFARSVRAADLDGDGDMDVLSASQHDDKIAWYENLGGGAFSQQWIVTTLTAAARAVHAADVDGDGDPDVLSASGGDGKIAWYENLGAGVFLQRRVITTDADGARSVHAADLDGDGDPDVLTASAGDDKIAWHENLGGGAFLPQRIVATDANGAESVFAADIDGDGDADVLSASHWGDRIAWHENPGGGARWGTRDITTDADGARSVHAADLDGDGDADVLSASAGDDKIAWYENLGRGEFSAQRIITTDANGAHSVQAADLDGDGDSDVLTASAGDDKVAWHANLGGGAFSTQRIIAANADGARSARAADLDGDGDADVLVASAGGDAVTWHENLGGGAFSAQRIITTDADGVRSVHAADLDGDGDGDVLSASSWDDMIAWHENLGDGAFSTRRVVADDAEYAFSVHAADLDGDGDIDVLSASDNMIAWYENRAPEPRLSAPAAAPAGVRVVADAASGDLTVTWNSVPEYADGGSPITGYVVVATPVDGGRASRCTVPAAYNQCHFGDLARDVFVYEVSVRAENAVGVGPRSQLVAAVSPGGHRFVGEDAGDQAGWSFASGGYGGGAEIDLILGAPLHSPTGREAAGAAYLIDAADLAAADDADASPDRVLDLGNVAGQYASWKLIGESAGDTAGWSVAAVAGHDGEVTARVYAAVGAPRAGEGAGAVYLVASGDLASADAADRSRDGMVDLGNVAAQADSWKVVGDAGARFGISVAPAGDIDGDGLAELLVHGAARRRGRGFGAAFVLSLDDAKLAAADEADGTTDGIIESHRLAQRAGFVEIFGAGLGGSAGTALAALGDADDDGRGDLLLGAPSGTAGGVAFYAAGADMPSGPDGAVGAEDLVEHSSSYRFVGEAPLDQAGAAVAAAGDTSGDGLVDLLVGAPGHSGHGRIAGGAAYLIASSSLAAADRADSDADGTVHLENVAAQRGSWKFVSGETFEGVGVGLTSAGDVDGDGLADLLIGTDVGGAYLVAAADLRSMDAADGSRDGVVDLRNAAAQENSWRIVWPGRVVGRGMNLVPGPATGATAHVQELLLAGAGVVWLMPHASLASVLANIDAADGEADGVVGFDALAARLAAPRDGNATLLSLELYQGPLAWTWDWLADRGTTYAPRILGRRAALVVRVAHGTRAVPQLAVRVLDSDGTPLTDGLYPLRNPETAQPDAEGPRRWETTYTLDLPGGVHRAGNRASFEVDPADALDETDERDNEQVIPFDGLSLPLFDIVFVPIRSPKREEPPNIDAELLMGQVLDLLPVADYRARWGPRLDLEEDDDGVAGLLGQLYHHWSAESDDGEFYHGIFVYADGDGGVAGQAYVGAKVGVSRQSAYVVSHEVGHNLSLLHTPACGPDYIDPNYPYAHGGIGPRRGWLFSGNRFVTPSDGVYDLMGYCSQDFISDYHYRKAAYHRSATSGSLGAAGSHAGSGPSGADQAPARSLALTGSVDDSGNWSLDRASVSRRAPRSPATGGSHVVALLDASGLELHSEPLAVYSVSHGEGSGWTVRVPLPDDLRYVVVRTANDHVLLEERLDVADLVDAAEATRERVAPTGSPRAN